jgi:hypothetical protein
MVNILTSVLILKSIGDILAQASILVKYPAYSIKKKDGAEMPNYLQWVTPVKF